MDLCLSDENYGLEEESDGETMSKSPLSLPKREHENDYISHCEADRESQGSSASCSGVSSPGESISDLHSSSKHIRASPVSGLEDTGSSEEKPSLANDPHCATSKGSPVPETKRKTIEDDKSIAAIIAKLTQLSHDQLSKGEGGDDDVDSTV